jgi:hypothetical protein
LEECGNLLWIYKLAGIEPVDGRDIQSYIGSRVNDARGSIQLEKRAYDYRILNKVISVVAVDG